MSNIAKLVKRLKKEDLVPNEELVSEILAAGPEARDELLALATDRELLREGYDEALGPLHALRLLGEIGDDTVIPELFKIFPLEYIGERDNILTAWAMDVPQIVARIASSPEVLWPLAEDTDGSFWQRGVAIDALGEKACILDEEQRAQILARLRRMLAEEQDSTVLARVIRAVGLLADKESYKAVMAAYRDKRVNTTALPAATARQLLLRQTGADEHHCAAHGFWDRYQFHGPFDDEEDDLAMDDEF